MGMCGQHHAPAALPPGKRPGTRCVGCWVGPRTGLDECGKSRPQRDSIPGPSSPWRVAIQTEQSRPFAWVIWRIIWLHIIWIILKFRRRWIIGTEKRKGISWAAERFFFFQLYNSLWVLACSIIPFHCFLFWVLCFQLLTPIFLKSFLTSSSHLTLGFPFGLVAYGFHLYMVLATLSLVILSTYPNQLSRLYFTYLTIFRVSLQLQQK